MGAHRNDVDFSWKESDVWRCGLLFGFWREVQVKCEKMTSKAEMFRRPTIRPKDVLEVDRGVLQEVNVVSEGQVAYTFASSPRALYTKKKMISGR